VPSELEEVMKKERLKKLLVGVFELWKTFPDAIRAAVLVSAMGVLVAVFWTGNKSSENQSTPVQPDTHPSERKEQNVPPPRAVRPQPPPPRPASVPRANEAQKTLALGNYAESYRQYRESLRSLPADEQERIRPQSEEAARIYERGYFREAAYMMQQAIDTTH
jgi:hypothetical protein